jgi:putative Mn2+ efflux pump MntP
MSFVGELLKNEHSIQWYSIIGIVIFVSLFAVMIYKTLKMSKKDASELGNSVFNE